MKAIDNFQDVMVCLIKAWAENYTENQKKDPENWPELETWQECLDDFTVWFETDDESE